ncbi:hypothetical protein FGG79_03320 [Bacillus sp. BHET2]|uniref:hypothetical protein n=1 Tax=Bacillus sp. BHET2 TaxID=2583818 RepID=UPI00110DF900|nr:hypothetical protein [Bacillus sp. BHET2]TMU87178.1 hypothetical protein FGG79_03320 [Bacillus sp. BHET2]
MDKIKNEGIGMKNILIFMTILFATVFLLMACSGAAKQNGSHDDPEVESVENDESAPDGAETDGSFDSVSMEDTSSNDEGISTEDSLSGYTSEKIEYARVWLQVNGNKDVEKLSVLHISAGEQLNPYDDDSVGYPEDVIVLTGNAMADGVITYSSNGDGTINVYDVPSHWPSSQQLEKSMEDYTKAIVEGTEQVSVGNGEDDEVIRLIGKINSPS